MQKKIILSLFILFSFFAVVILPASLDICIPNGCNFSKNACTNNSCVNETLGQHLGERTSLFSTIVKSKLSITLLAIVLITFFVSRKYFLELIRLAATKLYVKYKLFDSFCSKLFNYLLEAFSDGILHPQIYSLAN